MKYDLITLKPIAAIVLLTAITAAGFYYVKQKNLPESVVVTDIEVDKIEVADIDRADIAADDFVAEETKYTEVFFPTYLPKAKPKSKVEKTSGFDKPNQSKFQSKIKSKKSSKKNNKNIYTSGKWKGLPIIMEWTDKPVHGSELTPYGYRDR